MNFPYAPAGMRAVVVIQLGQFLSLVGTGMTRFALTLYAWQMTGEATALALVAFFSFLPVVLFSPVAGALVDRWNRKLVMMLSDLGAGAMTIFLFIMNLSGTLEIWHLFVAAFITGLFGSFQFPAYSASISLMVEKKDYARASAIGGVVESAAAILAPVLAGLLFGIIGLNGILLIDIISFTFAVGALVWVVVPQPPPTDPAKRSSLWEDSAFGFRYIFARPSLLGVQSIFFFGNLLFSVTMTLQSPMILARTGGDETALSAFNGAAALGGMFAGLVIVRLGVPHNRLRAVVGTWLYCSVMMIVLTLMRTPVGWALIGFLLTLSFPVMNGANQSLWMSKVPPQLQGRVFSVRRLFAQIAGPLGMVLSGPLADRVFEPAMRPDGSLAPVFGSWFGTGAGAGMAVLMAGVCTLIIVTTLAIYAIPHVRHVETIIPDYVPEGATG